MTGPVSLRLAAHGGLNQSMVGRCLALRMKGRVVFKGPEDFHRAWLYDVIEIDVRPL
jgi:hypothetical protein